MQSVLHFHNAIISSIMKYALILLYISEIIISCQSTKSSENTNGSQTKIIVNHDQYISIYLEQRLYVLRDCMYTGACALMQILLWCLPKPTWSGVCYFCSYTIVTALCWNPSEICICTTTFSVPIMNKTYFCFLSFMKLSPIL